MNFNQYNRPRKLNLDKSRKYLAENEAFFLLNHEIRIAQDKATPMAANYPLCQLDQPGGENYTIGTHKSLLTNETYSWHYNSNEVHYIFRINGNGECEIVNDDDCLPLSADPKHSIEQWRAYLLVEKICHNRDGKYLIWTNGIHTIGMLDVEASIATNSFRTPFFERCEDRCALLQMCVPEPCGCLQAEYIPLPQTEVGLQNNITDNSFQFMFRHVYYDNRESEWSDRSTTYFQDGRGCFESNIGLSRCMKLRIPIGNPLVDRIKIGVKIGDVWYLYDTVEKYKKYNSTQEKWYQRELAELTNYSDEDCSFDYIFCNDKQKIAIDTKELTIVRNPIPRAPQGLIPIKDALGFYNYEDGNCPIDKAEAQKFDIQISCDDTDCTPEFATITVRAIVHRFDGSKNQFIYREGGVFADKIDDISDPAYFGGVYNVGVSTVAEKGYSQVFSGSNRGFIIYVEGTDYWASTKQWFSRPYFKEPKEVGVVANMEESGTRMVLEAQISNGYFFYQEAKLKVPKGTRGFLRIASHEVESGTGANQNTSTSLKGLINNLSTYKGDSNITLDSTAAEIYFDTCNGDVEVQQVFVIQDNAVDTAYNGYITDDNGLPVEGAEIYVSSVAKDITDHNGFYNFYVNSQSVTANIHVEIDCSTFGNIQSMALTGVDKKNTTHSEAITNTTYNDNLYANIRMRVVDCDGTGVPSLRVALSGSKYRTTDSDGYANFKIRNYSTRNRNVRAVVMNNNGCFTTDCDDNCNPCMPAKTSATPACYFGKPTVTMDASTIKRDSIAISMGLKAGGGYPMGFVAKGDCGRISAVNEIKYINIPKTQEKNKIGFCNFSYTATDILLPDWVNCVQIVRGQNLNNYELQWSVDKIERTADGKIKLTIQSLNDYNFRYFFKTNTVYQWLKGDRIEFIRNGDGKIFSAATHGILNYLSISPFHDENISGLTDQPADYFNQLLITDDGRLSNLTEGAIIELQRPNVSASETIYNEICASIPVVNGRLVYESGTFKTFDTYLINRTDGNFLGAFEHHSPSDFWGNRVSDEGKAHVINKYENERRYGRNITISSPTQPNYFGDLIKTFDAPEHGDITSMNIVDGKIILAIGENDSFLAQAGDDFLRVGSDGIVRALPADAVISNAEPKLRGQYGCKYQDIGSIFYGDGFASFIDGKSQRYIIHNYQIAKVSGERVGQNGEIESDCNSYFNKRYQEKETFNRNAGINVLDMYRWSTGQNKNTGAIHLTLKSLRHSGVNNEKSVYQKPNETICYHPDTDDFLSFWSGTPEAYSNIDLFDGKGCAMICYLNGVPFITPTSPDNWNEFFEIPCDWVVGVSLNKHPTKIKIPLAMEVQSDGLWFVPEVTTEMINFRSEIPPIRWKRNNDKINAAFLSNINSRRGLYGTDGARGYYAAITMCRDNTNALRYGTIDNSKRIKYSELDLIMFKFSINEQSGLTENL